MIHGAQASLPGSVESSHPEVSPLTDRPPSHVINPPLPSKAQASPSLPQQRTTEVVPTSSGLFSMPSPVLEPNRPGAAYDSSWVYPP